MRELIAGDVVEMRGAIAKEKGDGDRWDLKYAAGGLVDIEFIAQYLQLVHAHEQPDILDTSTARVLDKAWALRLLAAEDAEVLRAGGAALSGPDADPAAVPARRRSIRRRRRRACCSLLARAADVPDFATLEATLIDTQARVRASFVRILGKAP